MSYRFSKLIRNIIINSNKNIIERYKIIDFKPKNNLNNKNIISSPLNIKKSNIPYNKQYENTVMKD